MSTSDRIKKHRFVLIGVTVLLLVVLFGSIFQRYQSKAAAENEIKPVKNMEACMQTGSRIQADCLQRLPAELVAAPVNNIQKLSAVLVVIPISDIKKLSAEFAEGVDREPPVISGVTDKQVMVGDTISYRSGVTAWDERDGQVQVTVDSSGVNLNAAGSYTVIYIAEDKAGNQATASATVEVTDITQEMVIQLADEVLAQITTYILCSCNSLI